VKSIGAIGFDGYADQRKATNSTLKEKHAP
jgi:hypothetical protein